MSETRIDDLDLEGVESSYKENHLGAIFFDLVKEQQPQRIVELGSYMGYSALHMAAGLTTLPTTNPPRELHLIDLWDQYEFRKCSLEKIQTHFEKQGFLKTDQMQITFKQKDALAAASEYADASIDMLHIDISNDGDKLKECLGCWGPKIHPRGVLVFEGGTQERDQIDWMVKYKKAPIADYLKSESFAAVYSYEVTQAFPSLTVARRKM